MNDSGNALRDSLSATAAAERNLVAREADAKAAALLARAEAEAAALRTKALALLERELAEEEARTLGDAALAERSALLSAKRVLIDEVYAAAKARIDLSSADARYGETISRLAVEAAEVLLRASSSLETAAGPAGEIRVRKADQELVRAALKRAGLDGRISVDAGSGGPDLPPGSVAAFGPEGRLHVDNGFATRLERSRERLASTIAAILFGGKSD
ncbi:MAG: V-type ATP synthase subunit E family protein [Treponemataceae bacterium]